MKKILIIAFLLISGIGWAQERYFYVNWNVSQPLSNKDWIKGASTRGIKAGYRGFITPSFAAGLDISSVAYDQYQPRETFQFPTGAITTDYFRYLYSHAATVSGQYYFKVGEGYTFFPYAGLGLGVNSNEYVIYYNIYDDREQTWGFLVRPEAGILVKIGSRGSWGAMAALHYDYSTSKSEKFDYSSFSSLGFQVGIMLMEL